MTRARLRTLLIALAASGWALAAVASFAGLRSALGYLVPSSLLVTWMAASALLPSGPPMPTVRHTDADDHEAGTR